MESGRVYEALERALAQPRFARLYGEVQQAFRPVEGIGHNWEHVRRVVVNAAMLCEEEGADPDIVMAGAMLHDLGFALVPDEPKKHHLHGAARCHAYLEAWTPSQREAIAGCVRKHKGRYPGYGESEPETLEEKVVADADGIDKSGWIGLLQVAKVYAEYGARGMEKYRTMAGLADGLIDSGAIHLYTESARRFARERAEPDRAAAGRQLRRELELYLGWSR